MSRPSFPVRSFFWLFLFVLCLTTVVSAQISRAKPRSGVPDIFGANKATNSCCGAKQNTESFSPLTSPVYESYKLTATYYSLKDNLTTTLMLNNKGPEPILATPTFYSLDGTRLQIAPITVPAASYIDVDMHQLLAGASEEFNEGSLKIGYQGGNYQLGAQIKMVDAARDLIWAEQLVYTSKFTSNRLENVWWLPDEDAKARLVVSNTSSSVVTVTLRVDGTSPQQNSPVQIILNPWETRVLDIMRDIVGHPNGQLHAKGGVSIMHTGTPGAVLGRMFVAKPSFGYSAATNFVDPDATVSQKWHGNGLRFRNLDGSQLRPILVARNTTNQISRIHGRILYTKPNGTMRAVAIPLTPLAPNSTKFINLYNLLEDANVQQSVAYGGIELEYNTPKGTVITSVQSVSPNGEHVFQVPMFDPQKLPSSAGGFPWKADGDFSTIVYIKNETDVTRKYTVNLLYDGGAYAVGLRDLRANETIALDFRTIRDDQAPDVSGNIIPINLVKGQIAWSAIGTENKVMSGRSEQISVSGGVASTYACSNCCPDTFNDGWILPSTDTITIGEEVGFIALQQNRNCNFQPFPPFQVSANWISSTPSVASVGYSGEAEGISAGDSTISASWDAETWFPALSEYCEQGFVQANYEAPVTVPPCAYPVNFRQEGAATDIGNGILQFRYTWDSSTGTSSAAIDQLYACELIEETGISGSSSNPYYPPPPFPLSAVPNPGGSTGYSMAHRPLIDNHRVPGTPNITTVPVFITPYQNATYTVNQAYKFRCPCYQNYQFQVLLGNINIVRSVSPATGSNWKYTVTKSGASATINPLP